jgi:hypothetical protein
MLINPAEDLLSTPTHALKLRSSHTVQRLFSSHVKPPKNRARQQPPGLLFEAMADAAQILLVGNDGRLLNERAELLTHFWEIAAISTFDDGASQLRQSDLLVLCHTVTDEQRLTWISGSRADSPTRPIISLEFLDPADAGRRNGADATVDHARGPAALVSTIYELLNERGLGSKPWTGGGHTLLGADGQPETELAGQTSARSAKR